MKTFAKFSLVVALALVLGLSASAEDRKPLIEKKEAKEPTNDKEFITHAAACEIAEVKVSEFVAKSGFSADVQKFAQRMVDEHTKLRDRMRERGRDMKIAVFEGLEKEKQDRFDQLKKLKGSDFDREYMRWMIEGHEKALRAYEKWSKDAADPKLRDECAKAV